MGLSCQLCWIVQIWIAWRSISFNHIRVATSKLTDFENDQGPASNTIDKDSPGLPLGASDLGKH